MRLQALFLGAIMLSLFVAASEGHQVLPKAGFCAKAACDGRMQGHKTEWNRRWRRRAAPSSYGNREVSAGPFGLWPDGTIVFKPRGAGFVTRNGSLGMKFGWMRGVSGELRITGRRLDAVAPPLRSEVPSGYGDRGFQVSYLIFPTPGCWEVTGSVGQSSVTFVTKVVKIGKGPPWRRTDIP